MPACPACGEPAREADVGAVPSRRRLDAEGIGSTRYGVSSRALAVCRVCGLGWQVPLPETAEVTAAYVAMRDDVYMSEAANRRLTFERGVRLLSRHGARPPGRLLDVGCSAGLFLDVATRAGWDVLGVEPSEWLSAKARELVGSRVFTGTFEGAPLGDRCFDVVTMWDVLEHVPSPPNFLARARRVSSPGGLLVLNVPARDTWIARALGARWPLLLPEHLFYFSRPSLRVLLDRAGFDVLAFHRHWVSFSAAYVLRRLAQHGWPLAAQIEPAHAATWLRVPLLMGELTVVASSRRE
jgi:SAM-dependent methyltransferase